MKRWFTVLGLLLVFYGSFGSLLAEDSESVTTSYEQKGYFLALIPLTFMVHATAYANGEVELKYPWYSFLTLSNKEEVRTKLKVAVNKAMKTHLLGSVQAEGKPANPVFTREEGEKVMVQMQMVLKENYSD